MPSGITKGRAMSCCSRGVPTSAAPARFDAANDWAGSCVIIIGRQREGMTRREPMGVEPHSSRARRDAPYRRTASHGAQTENNKRQQTIRIKDMRQGLHTLVQTQGLDGLQHLFNRLAPRGRVLLFCLLCAEAGWTTLVIAWLLLERAYLKMRLFLTV